MDYTENRFAPAMTFIGLLVIMVTLDFTAAQTGVCYGRVGDNLLSPSEVVALFKQNNIRRMRIYAPFHPTLEALGGSDIELILDIPNVDLEHIAASQDNANAWVQTNVLNYPNVQFRYIAVGNEVSSLNADTSRFVQFVLPAMQNIHNAVSSSGLGDRIRVSTAIDTRILNNTFPPENGAFSSDVTSYMNPIVAFLVQTRAPLLANIYPYFAYFLDTENIPLEYALFTSSEGVNADGVSYQNLFYAILDGLYAALEKSGGSSVKVVVSKSGWPSAGGGDTTSVEYAKRPGRAIETYIFIMFDENQKSPEYEKSALRDLYAQRTA